MIHQVRQHLPHTEGDVLRHQLRGEEPRLQAGPVQDCDVAVVQFLRRPLRQLPDPPPDLPGDPECLLGGVPEHQRVHRLSRRLPGPDLLFEAPAVLPDQPVRSLHDLRGGAEIHIQQHLLRSGVIFSEAQHDLGLCPAETVDRLVVVAHDGQIVLRAGDHPDDLVLQAVDVLEFIHQDPLPALLHRRQDIRAPGEKLIGHEEHVLIIDLF